MANNVIVFPKQNRNYNKPISIEEINQNVEMMNHYHIQETISNLVPLIFTQLEIAGFSLEDMGDEFSDDTIRDGAFLIESLRSLMCKHYGLYHPFQKIVDNVFIPDQTETGALKIVDELIVNLKEEEESDNS